MSQVDEIDAGDAEDDITCGDNTFVQKRVENFEEARLFRSLEQRAGGSPAVGPQFPSSTNE